MSAESREWVCGGRRSSREIEGSDLLESQMGSKEDQRKRRLGHRGLGRQGAWRGKCEQDRAWGLPGTGGSQHRRITGGSRGFCWGARGYHEGFNKALQQAALHSSPLLSSKMSSSSLTVVQDPHLPAFIHPGGILPTFIH